MAMACLTMIFAKAKLDSNSNILTKLWCVCEREYGIEKDIDTCTSPYTFIYMHAHTKYKTNNTQHTASPAEHDNMMASIYLTYNTYTTQTHSTQTHITHPQAQH